VSISVNRGEEKMVGRFLPVLALIVAVAGCSSSSDSGGSKSTSGNDAGGSTGGDDGGGSTSSSLKAPKVTMIMAMEGALHVQWTNNQTGCDSVEGERKMMGMGDYAAAFFVPGTVDNKMDAAATENMTYMYRLRCKKGGAYSPYSNEMGANPKQGMDMDGGMGMD
jgi:hypothetical protein